MLRSSGTHRRFKLHPRHWAAQLNVDPLAGVEGWETDPAERIDLHWSRFLGVPASALRRPGVVVAPHAELDGYRGVWFFVRGHSAVVSAPPEWVPRLQRVLGSAAATELVSPVSAARALRDAAGQIIGPSFQGWLSPARFRPVASDCVHRVSESKAAIISGLQSACSPTEWDHTAVSTPGRRRSGHHSKGRTPLHLASFVRIRVVPSIPASSHTPPIAGKAMLCAWLVP